MDAAKTSSDSQSSPRKTVFVGGFWRRGVATLVDTAVLAPVLLLVGWITLRMAGARLPMQADLGPEALVELFLEEQGILAGLLALELLVLLLYGFLFMVTTGATPGLRLLRLKVINVYGQTPEWWRGLLRCTGFLASLLLLGLGFLWMGFDREKRGLHDWVAGTYVIRAKGTPSA